MNDSRRRGGAIGASLAIMLAGCAWGPTWHWERPGASAEEYSFELNQCKAAVYTDASGFVTQETVRRMQVCMERKGWRRVGN